MLSVIEFCMQDQSRGLLLHTGLKLTGSGHDGCGYSKRKA